MAAAVSPTAGEAGDKRPGAFRTISEVADELDVPQHVLRFWETRFPQIRPLKRAGGRRYYRPEDVDLLRGVRRLLHGQGYTIKGAQRVIRESGVRVVQAVGRGEAEIGAPAAGEVEARAPEDRARSGSEAADDGADRRVLREVLRELHACRAAIAGLRKVSGV